MLSRRTCAWLAAVAVADNIRVASAAGRRTPTTCHTSARSREERLRLYRAGRGAAYGLFHAVLRLLLLLLRHTAMPYLDWADTRGTRDPRGPMEKAVVGMLRVLNCTVSFETFRSLLGGAGGLLRWSVPRLTGCECRSICGAAALGSGAAVEEKAWGGHLITLRGSAGCGGGGAAFDAKAAAAALRECDAVVMWFHGGGYIVGSGSVYMPAFCSLLHRLQVALASSGVLRPRVAIVSVEYALAPHAASIAAQVAECRAAFSWLTTAQRGGVDASRVLLCGDSAGGNLALQTALYARDAGRQVAGMWLVSPWAAHRDGCVKGEGKVATGGSYDECHSTDYLSLPWIMHCSAIATSSPREAASALASPLLGGGARFAGLAGVLMWVGGAECFRDDVHALAAAMRADGVAVEVDQLEWGAHILPMLFPVGGPRSSAALDRFAQFGAARVRERMLGQKCARRSTTR